ncbi:MAG TPA: hypothetical protein VIQ25_17315 [Gemmatimonadales bacterium]|jgi:hypothetical protein
MTGATALLALVFSLVPVSAGAQLPDTLPGQSPDTLPRQVPAGPGDLVAKVAGVCRVQIAPAYRYLGGQRFILQEAADAEQHFYARADTSGKILQLYWFQVESKLPGQGAGYNYGRDSAITINDIPFAVSLREARGDADPPPGSDGAAMMDFVKAAGLTFPPMGRPLRIVHTAKPGARQELMVIYLESKGMAKADPTFDGVFKRGKRALRFVACH